MPIQSEWGNAHETYIVTTFRQEWTWSELHSHESNSITHFLRNVPQPTALIMDLRNSVWVKPDDLTAEISKSAALHEMYNAELVIFVLADVAVGTLLVQMHMRYGWEGCQYVHLTSMEQAHELVRSRFAYQT